MPMVKETLHIFDLGDLRAIRLQCNSCMGEIVQPILSYKIPKNCPLCRQDWEEQSLLPGNIGANEMLARAIQNVVQSKGLLMTIRFEIDGEAEKKVG